MNKIKNVIFSDKKRTIVSICVAIVVFVLASFGINRIVTAAEDDTTIDYENVTIDVIDGTPNKVDKDSNNEVTKEYWDADNNAGNDDSSSNGIIRNFDTISYNIKTKIIPKDSNSTASGTRTVEYHVYIPSQFDVSVSSEEQGLNKIKNDPEKNIVSNYDHYVIEDSNGVINVENTKSIKIVIRNGVQYTNDENNLGYFKPIIKVRVANDVSTKDNLNSVKNSLEGHTYEKLKISAIEKYQVKLYNGTTIENDEEVTTIPVGILIYLPNDGDKGIRGIQVPSNPSFDMEIGYENGSGTINYEYKEELAKLENYNNQYTIPGLPLAFSGNNNGLLSSESSINNITNEYIKNVTQKFIYNNVKYNNGKNTINLNSGIEGAGVNEVIYLSSKVYVINVKKKGTIDTKLKFSVTKNGVESSIYVVDNYTPKVGEYYSDIDFISEEQIKNESGTKFETPGKAMFNYNEEFYIQNTIRYAENSNIGGDTLTNLTNYIKIDNSIINVINMQDSDNYYLNISSTKPGQDTEIKADMIQYGLGSWDANNFELKDDAPDYCKSVPTDKDQLMNMYGGPCIIEKQNKISWVSPESITADNRKNIIMVRFKFDKNYIPATVTTIRLKAQIVSDISKVGETAQVVSRGTTYFNNSLYYLSETADKSVSVQTTDLNYQKSKYDKINRKFTSYGNEISGDVIKNHFGNTLLVTSFKIPISTEIYDSNDSNQTNGSIYSGITDPLSIQITPTLYKSDSAAEFTGATITVYLPVELELEIQENDREPSKILYNQEIGEQNKKYNVYEYIYTDTDFTDATKIPTLVLHAYIDISSPSDNMVNVISTVDANIKSNKDTTNSDNSYVPIEYRTDEASFTIMNTKIIGTIGRVTPSRFEKNGSYEYNMRAANSSNSSVNLSLLKILPFNGDNLNDGSDFDGALSVKLNETLPSGYKVYYTKATPNTIITNELNSNSLNNWVEWGSYTTEMMGITAIKITGPTINSKQYFGPKEGIDITVRTSQSEEGNEYYNNFYMLQEGSINCDGELESGCSNTTTNGITPYASNISYTSIYNRSISGYVFEDYNYDAFYSSDEKRLADIPVEVYKLYNEVVDKKDPLSAISENDQLVGETITDKNGAYKVKGLTQGNYYVKYTFDCDKYTVTEKNKEDITLGDMSKKDSDAVMVANTCTAVSNIITLDNNDTTIQNIDLGLRIRKNFDVTIKKYITNVTINSNKGTKSYDYQNETKVKVDVKNLRNTSFRVTYKFVIENSKYFPGTIGQIVETIPEGMTFDPTLPENEGWYMSGDYLYYTNYAKTYILPDEKYYMTIVLDLKTDTGGEYLNIVAAQDLKIMDTTSNTLDGVEIQGVIPDTESDITINE